MAHATSRGGRAWEAIFDEYRPAIYRFLRARVATEEHAETLAANVFWQAFRSINRFSRPEKPFAIWLSEIARRELAAYYHSRHGMERQDEQHRRSTRDRASSIEIGGRLTRLPVEYREAIELRFVLGLSNIEAATAMGRSHSSYRAILRHAIQALRGRSDICVEWAPPGGG